MPGAAVTWMLPVRSADVLAITWNAIGALPVPKAPPVICIHVTSLVALHPQPVPVLTVKRLSLSFASTLALFPERLKLLAEPSCVRLLVRFFGSELPLRKMVAVRELTQVFAATVMGTTALVMPPALVNGMVSQLPALLDTAQAQFAVTVTAPLPPFTGKVCAVG